jgi:hypothetical protein
MELDNEETVLQAVHEAGKQRNSAQPVHEPGE